MKTNPSPAPASPESERLDALPAPTAEQLVSSAVMLKRQIAGLQEDLAGVEAQIVKLGAGKHSGFDDDQVTVVAAAAATPGKVSYPALAAEKEGQARELSGEAFSKLFDRAVVFTPCAGFENVVPKLISAKKTSAALLRLCEAIGKPYTGRAAYVKYPESAKA